MPCSVSITHVNQAPDFTNNQSTTNQDLQFKQPWFNFSKHHHNHKSAITMSPCFGPSLSQPSPSPNSTSWRLKLHRSPTVYSSCYRDHPLRRAFSSAPPAYLARAAQLSPLRSITEPSHNSQLAIPPHLHKTGRHQAQTRIPAPPQNPEDQPSILIEDHRSSASAAQLTTPPCRLLSSEPSSAPKCPCSPCYQSKLLLQFLALSSSML